MKLVTFEKDGRSAVGLLNAAGTAVHPVPGCADMQTLIGIWPVLDTAAVLRGEALPLKSVRLLAPIPRPVQDVICLGINYFDHAKESESVAGKGVKAPDTFPIYFSKRVDEAVAPGGDILSHSDLVADLDYEAELAVIIGKAAYNVTEADALDYVFGYTILNDVSARTIQNQHKQWYRGKSLDGFTPMVDRHAGGIRRAQAVEDPEPHQRRAPAGQHDRPHDLPRAVRDCRAQPGHDAPARHDHLHGHAGRRGHGL